MFYKHLKFCLTKFLTVTSFTISSKIVFFNSASFNDFCRININVKTWHFLIVKTSIDIKIIINNLCIDTKCETPMTNRIYIDTMFLNYSFKIRITASLKIEEIDEAITFSTEFIVLNFSFSDTINENFTIVKFSKEMRIVNKLSAKVFIEMNIIDLDTINFDERIIRIIVERETFYAKI